MVNRYRVRAQAIKHLLVDCADKKEAIAMADDIIADSTTILAQVEKIEYTARLVKRG